MSYRTHSIPLGTPYDEADYSRLGAALKRVSPCSDITGRKSYLFPSRPIRLSIETHRISRLRGAVKRLSFALNILDKLYKVKL